APREVSAGCAPAAPAPASVAVGPAAAAAMATDDEDAALDAALGGQLVSGGARGGDGTAVRPAPAAPDKEPPFVLEYKFVVHPSLVDVDGRQLSEGGEPHWEAIENRRVELPRLPGLLWIVSDTGYDVEGRELPDPLPAGDRAEPAHLGADLVPPVPRLMQLGPRRGVADSGPHS
ncbi:unnamed protein product, partial [Prorocentrum cordatum]